MLYPVELRAHNTEFKIIIPDALSSLSGEADLSAQTD
jgi:hypothetical protein